MFRFEDEGRSSQKRQAEIAAVLGARDAISADSSGMKMEGETPKRAGRKRSQRKTPTVSHPSWIEKK